MSLSRKQFDILEAYATNSHLTQRGLAEITNQSGGNVNRLVKELVDAGLVENGKVTADGLAALEPYRVKRAVFLAAGVGSRLMPVTLNTPKPLVRVKGKRIIDGLIDEVLALGIQEIYIVRGYLSEQFDQIQSLYPILIWKKNFASAVINQHPIIPILQSCSVVTMLKVQDNCVRSVSTNYTRCRALCGVR